MSWQDDILNKVFTIKTGDELEYTPKWRGSKKEVEYNVSIYDFVNVTGSYIDRRKPKARRFELEFYFDGENAVQIGNNFEISARDSRLWTVQHPYYGELKCQPISLEQDNSTYNVSKFTVPVLETLLEGWPTADIVVLDEISNIISSLNESQINAYKDVADKTAMNNTVDSFDTIASKSITKSSNLAEFKKKVSSAIIAIDAVEFDAVFAIREMQSLVNFPANFYQTIQDRFNIFNEALINLITSYTGSLENAKHIEIFGGTLIGGMAKSMVSNITTDYDKRTDISGMQDSLMDAYNRYLIFLDSQLTIRADTNMSYVPDYSCFSNLDDLVNFTISNLYNFVFKAKQERRWNLDKDSNAIILTHKFYGIDDKDENLMRFIKDNDIGITEIFNIKKDREVLYYV